MSQFCHLHVHSEYSLLDGMSRIEDMVKRAKELDQPAIALTDHGVMFGAIEFYRAAKKHDIKPIIGVEAYLSPRAMQDRDPKLDRSYHHMLLLAQNQTGYKNLLKLCSLAQMQGFYGKPRIDKETLAAHAEGLIATTGCLAAEVPRVLVEQGEEAAYNRLKWYLDVFGRDRFFLELQGHDIPELRTVNRVLPEWSKKYGVGLVATNDVHYVRKEDAGPHDILLCMQTRDTMSNPNRMRLTPDGSYYITSYEEMMGLFGDFPDALKNTLLVAEMCEVDLDMKGYHLPQFPVPDGYTDAEAYLRALVEQGVTERYGPERAKSDPVLRERVERELGIIHNMGFDNYFLIVWDLCRHAAEVDIWWNVRGSGAGSVVAYTLRITNIDPIGNDLIFERFLNPARVSMPDIDIDFPDDRRHEMIEYTVRRYGNERCAAIITFGTLGARAAVRDVGRALEVPLSEVDRVARMVPNVPGKPVKLDKLLFDDATAEEWPMEAEDIRAAYKEDPVVRDLLDTAVKLEGQTRHASTHAAGIVISDAPIVEYAPLHRPTKGDDSGPIQQVVQFDMNIVESIGLLKVDFLGLATLSIMRRASEHIEQRHGRKLNLSTIPYLRCPDDPVADADVMQAFQLLQSGHTVGVFQVEGAGLRRTLQEMQPSEFEHIIAAISLYRPGPMEYIPTYIRRMHGEEEVAYHHPKLRSILSNTYGICVSGDALITDARTGRRYRLDEIGSLSEFWVQGVNEQWQPAVGRVTHWIDSGHKPVYRLMLRNGASIKVTEDHRLLTEAGWKPLKELQKGDFIATPPYLIGSENGLVEVDRRRLRVLAYLIGDGSLTSGTTVDFVSKDPNLVTEYRRCLEAFADVRSTTLTQVRGVTRVSTAKARSQREANYHSPTGLLVWLRELGLKYAPGTKPGGASSADKFVPPFIFELGNEEIAFFLASLWDCDGYMGHKLCHYKTISRQLAEDVQSLLLRLGISSTIYRAAYENGEHERASYQVTVYDTARLAEQLQVHMLSPKRDVLCQSGAEPTIERAPFIAEVDDRVGLSRRALMERYGIDRQHFHPVGRRRARISTHVVTPLVEQVDLPQTRQSLNVLWQEVMEIEPAGVEHVYDLTVEGLHNFVANNIVVHNCVYQEQIMRMATDLAGYSPGEADLMRRAVSKKKAKDIEYHKGIFVAGAVNQGIPQESAERIYADIEFFARYGFNKCVVGETEVLDAATGRLVRVDDLYAGRATLDTTITCDVERLALQSGRVSQAMDNGVKPVFRLTTALGRTIEATANHPFYTFDGWKLLAELREGDQLAVPRHVPVEGAREWPEHEVIALGHLLAEGNLCHPHSVYFYTQDPVQRDDFVQAAEQFENVQCTVALHKETFSVYAARKDKALAPGIVPWAQRLGIWGKGAREKEIPGELFELTNRQVGLLLSRMWEGDGHINEKGRSLFYATASERMARQMQHLLLRFGIISRLRTVTFPYKEGRIGYQLFVTGNDNIARFAEHIGCHFLSEQRREALQRLWLAEPTSTASKDVVPVGVKALVRSAKEQQGVTWTQLREECGVAQREFYPTGAASKHGFTRQTIGRLADYFDDADLRRYAESDIYWDRVVSIEYVGEQQTYDLEVPGTHNFVANDILVHNSHAADYAVITVQTAYLKAHYPVEYLCALLEVEFDDSAKVPVFLNECRRLEIAVLPPDINMSGAKFTIEENPANAHLPESDYRRWAIRVGMGAIKNVGLGAVEMMIAEREANGPFKSLDDFCERVDLRHVNRRVLECMAKVGCFDDLVRPVAPVAPRETVLAVLDRMMGVSGQAHAAADVGQMSMFDMFGGGGGGAGRSSVLRPLPDVGQVIPKQRLLDEKELLGLYISEHPLQQVANEVGKSITCFCGEISSEQIGQTIVIAGLLSSVRTITTKKGDRMAFAKLEDLQGEIEVVVFPRTYEEAQGRLVQDKILLVRGKVESRNDSMSVLADEIREWEASALHPSGNGAGTNEHAPTPAGVNGQNGNGNGHGAEPPSEEPSLLDGVKHHVTITLTRTDDDGQDLTRLRRVMEALQGFQGEDRVSMRCVINGGRTVHLNFPDLTTQWNAELRDVLLGQGVDFETKDMTPDPRAAYRKHAEMAARQ